MVAAISADAIRERAYLIWEREGRPHGRDLEHWVRAEVELIAEVSNANNAVAKAAPARARVGGGNGAPSPKAAAPRARRSSPGRGSRARYS